MKKFKYLGILFSSKGTREREMGQRIGVVLRSLCCTVVKRDEPEGKALNLPVNLCSYPHLWSWRVGHDRKNEIMDTSCRNGFSGVSLRDRVRSSAIWEGLRGEPLLLCVERSQLRWFGHLVRMPPGSFPWRRSRHVQLGEATGRPRTRWRDYISTLAWEHLGIPQSELADIAGKREVWETLLELLPPRPDLR